MIVRHSLLLLYTLGVSMLQYMSLMHSVLSSPDGPLFLDIRNNYYDVHK